jgi:hypothetical protein
LGRTVTTADGPTTRRVALLATCTTSSMGRLRAALASRRACRRFRSHREQHWADWRVEQPLLVPERERARCRRARPVAYAGARAGGATGSDCDCVARAGEGVVWYRRACRRSHVVLAGLGLVRCALGTGGVGCRRFGLSAPRIRRVQAERGMSGCAFRLLEAGLAATDRHPICTGLGLGGDDHQRYRKSADSGNR